MLSAQRNTSEEPQAICFAMWADAIGAVATEQITQSPSIENPLTELTSPSIPKQILVPQILLPTTDAQEGEQIQAEKILPPSTDAKQAEKRAKIDSSPEAIVLQLNGAWGRGSLSQKLKGDSISELTLRCNL